MSGRKICPRPIAETQVALFENSEEAWFWYCRSQILRDSGARLSGNDNIAARPCDADDIYKAVKSLLIAGRLRKYHLKTLLKFGYLSTPPDDRVSEQKKESGWWKEALNLLSTILRQKRMLL
ncbi:MAG: hypothetical protein KAJ75_07815 [Alphaproteobacteria bacterium]|nr:hypothetical protein [Alphaproteobacteria bacterium]